MARDNEEDGRMKRFATQKPIAFSLLATAAFFVLMAGAFILGAAMSDVPQGKDGGEFLGKVLVALVFILVLRRFQWLRGAGITRFGGWKSWLVLLIPLGYAVLSTTYALTGGIRLSFANWAIWGHVPQVRVPNYDPGRYAWITTNMMGGGLAEEVVYRGLILFCLLSAWKSKADAALRAGIVSAAVFGYSHLVWVLLGKDLALGFLQSTAALCSGVFYAGVWIQTRSIWPVVLIHGLTNAFVYVRISEIPDFNETIGGGIADIALSLPLVLLGVFLLWRHSRKGAPSDPDAGR